MGFVDKHVLKEVIFTQELDVGKLEIWGEHSWQGLQPEHRPRGRIKNNEYFQGSIIKPLCWPHPPEVSPENLSH